MLNVNPLSIKKQDLKRTQHLRYIRIREMLFITVERPRAGQRKIAEIKIRMRLKAWQLSVLRLIRICHQQKLLIRKRRSGKTLPQAMTLNLRMSMINTRMSMTQIETYPLTS